MKQTHSSAASKLTFCVPAARAPEVPGDGPKGNKGVELLCPLGLWEQHGRGGRADSRRAAGIWVQALPYKENVKFPPPFSLYLKQQHFIPSDALHGKHIRLTLCCVVILVHMKMYLLLPLDQHQRLIHEQKHKNLPAQEVWHHTWEVAQASPEP